MVMCFWFELCWKPEQGSSCAGLFEACCFQFLFTERAFIWFVMGIFFLLLPKQLQAWKGIRHRATSNLLACKKKKKKLECSRNGKKKKRLWKGRWTEVGQRWGRKSFRGHSDWLLYKEQTPTYFVILNIIGQIGMYLIYYAHSYQRGWLSFE